MSNTQFNYRSSHVGMCVRDVAATLRFYVDGLGFKKITEYVVDEQIPEVDAPCSLTATFIERDGMRFELLDYLKPGVIGAPPTRRNQVGLTHISFFADDIDAAAQALTEFGGTIIENTRVGAEDPTLAQYIFLADPDGNRVELMHIPAGTAW
ncbi:catechol 2,3-dioxygenase-like lactoylglutathione lyase family enzyme [Leucobacter exalbidus]|uniref:Catechol 2,3-dioxygenase-like lactoylglutathione lyase family enzyme n=1 Tax=Leucobacter exalbidus TaxID=662960 RepID=A0A940PL83_9MICO|nr:VOC family protein [Leucobacter exalbidus]MBP1325987.1 catechol 2,3-dioxygenase-like lactoylglutathione lyase family enzyme [Leucobacter exalbidus]